MQIQSLAYRTDLIFPRFDGKVIDRGSYMVVETPANPGFVWGNFLLFKSPPVGAYPLWTDLFREEFAHDPSVKHIAFAWDGPSGDTGEVTAFLSEGFTIEKSAVMTANRVRRPVKFHQGIIVRPLGTKSEWIAATENQILCRSAGFELNAYRDFKEKQMARYQRMTEKGVGQWFGAFLDDRLVGDLGIFIDQGFGRFQVVETHPEFRRQGICGALVHQASEFAFRHMGIHTLVIVADPDDHPFRVYSSVGFETTEIAVGMCRNNKAKT